MNIVLASGATVWQITSPVDVPPQKVFRKIINLQFDTGTHADSIKIDTQQTQLQGAFIPKQYDSLDNASPIHANVHPAADNMIIISLDAPRRIKRIRIHPIEYSDYLAVAKAIENGTFNYRYNMPAYQNLSAAAAKPAAAQKAPMSINDIKAEASAAYQVGELWSVGVEKIELYRVDGEAIAEEPTFTVDNNQDIDDFIVTKFAIKAIDESQQYADLETHHLADVMIQSNPTGPRIGIAAPPGAGETHNIIEYFWNVPGEIAAQVDTVPKGKNPAQELSKALDRYIKDRFKGFFADAKEQEQPVVIPDKINIDVVFESDAPCDFQAEQFDIHYVLIRQQSSFPYVGIPAQEKSVLRFDGSALNQEQVIIEVPGNANVVTALLKTEASLGGEASYVVGNGMEALTATQKNGINIVQDRYIAQPVLPEQAVRINGFSLALMNLEKDTELLFEFQEDWNGQPSGKKLAEAKVRLSQLGKRSWSKISLKNAITLSTQTYWILLKSAKGSALWFTRNGVFEPLQVMQAAKAPAAPEKTSAIKGVQAYYALFSCCPSGDQAHAPFTLSIGNSEVPLLTMANETITYDIKDVLNNQLMDAGETGLVPVSIHFASAHSGLVTVWPPYIEYDLIT